MVARDGSWRRELRRELALLMTLKLAALLLLWALFFSGAHRPVSGARATERIFGPQPAGKESAPGASVSPAAQPLAPAPAARESRDD